MMVTMQATKFGASSTTGKKITTMVSVTHLNDFLSGVIIKSRLRGKKLGYEGGSHITMASIRASAVTGSIPSIPKKFLEENKVDVAEVNQWFCLEERGQWIENVNRTHLVLSSGKLVQKKIGWTMVDRPSK